MDENFTEEDEYLVACQEYEEKMQQQIPKALDLVKVLVDRKEELKNELKNQIHDFHQTKIYSELFDSELDLTKQPEPVCNCHNKIMKQKNEAFIKKQESLNIQIKRARTLHRKAEMEYYNATWKRKALEKRISDLQEAQKDIEQVRKQMNKVRIQIKNMEFRIEVTKRNDLKRTFSRDLAFLNKDLESTIEIENEGRRNIYRVRKRLTAYKRFLRNTFLDHDISFSMTF